MDQTLPRKFSSELDLIKKKVSDSKQKLIKQLARILILIYLKQIHQLLILDHLMPQSWYSS